MASIGHRRPLRRGANFRNHMTKRRPPGDFFRLFAGGGNSPSVCGGRLFATIYRVIPDMKGARLAITSLIAIAFGGLLPGLGVRNGSAGTAVEDSSVAQPPGHEVQTSSLQARHRSGQTILTWKEAIPVFDQVDPTVEFVLEAKKQFDQVRKVSYRVYRSDRPIASLDGLAWIAEVPPLTGWNLEFFGRSPKPTDKALRYVVEDGGSPIPPHTGVYAINSNRSGASYYAVTVVVNGRENRTVSRVSDGNVLVEPIAELAGAGEPILQRVRKPSSFNYVDNPTLEYYVRWEAPPNSSVPSRPFDYLVGLPPNLKKPAPVGIHMHCYGANLESCFGWWFNDKRGAVYVASNNLPQDWWTGYPDRGRSGSPLKTKQDWAETIVRPYTQRRLLSFLDWAADRYDLDLTRTFAAGISMGGSGALMMAIRHPDRIAWAIGWVPIHRPIGSPAFKSSYQGFFGDPSWGVRFEDGTPVWEYFDNVHYLRNHVAQDTPFLTFSNGKNDNGIGWQQAVEFYRILQETRRPHLFTWGQNGHGERARMPLTGDGRTMPLDLRTNQTIPAFTNGSLDDDPGSGDPSDGAPSGKINAYLYWETETVLDTPGVWEMTVGLTSTAPQDECTVDLTPRRVQQFRTFSGERVRWMNTGVGRKTPIQSGEVTADQWGLITLPQIVVTKGKNTIRIVRDR
jgi:pimeloyl-ACP methyl ester carboxylesterase